MFVFLERADAEGMDDSKRSLPLPLFAMNDAKRRKSYDIPNLVSTFELRWLKGGNNPVCALDYALGIMLDGPGWRP